MVRSIFQAFRTVINPESALEETKQVDPEIQYPFFTSIIFVLYILVGVFSLLTNIKAFTKLSNKYLAFLNFKEII